VFEGPRVPTRSHQGKRPGKLCSILKLPRNPNCGRVGSGPTRPTWSRQAWNLSKASETTRRSYHKYKVVDKLWRGGHEGSTNYSLRIVSNLKCLWCRKNWVQWHENPWRKRKPGRGFRRPINFADGPPWNPPGCEFFPQIPTTMIFQRCQQMRSNQTPMPPTKKTQRNPLRRAPAGK